MTTSTKAAVAESVTLREAVTEMRDCQGINDARLVEMTREGGQEAFAELVRRYENRLIRVISRLVILKRMSTTSLARLLREIRCLIFQMLFLVMPKIDSRC